MPRFRAIGAVAVAALTTAALATAPALAAPRPAAEQVAPGAPGALSFFDLARKDCVGTARNTTSRVWFTVANGVLSDVYEPTIDNTNVQSLQYVVTDGATFTDLQQRDTTYTVRADATGMVCTVTAKSAAHGYTLTTTYLTDPARDSVVMRTTLDSARKLKVYARLDAHVNGNGGGGDSNGGADTGRVIGGVPVVGDANTVSQATNRDYAVPTYMALDASTRRAASVGYAGTSSDALTSATSAPDGHVVAYEDVTPNGKAPITMTLGFGRSAYSATKVAAASLHASYPSTQRTYVQQWTKYDTSLRRPHDFAQFNAYYLSANVLKASEDKRFPGALVASLASPWGQAISAGDLVNGKPVYFGSYREVFARDLYEGVTGFLADGDIASARAATRFLLERQQQPAGNMPRNSLLNGKVAPDTGGDQLDETAYPILMAYLSGLASDATLYSRHIRAAADYLVSHSPQNSTERWEEQSGYSPSTIAAEIAGLTAASVIAARHGDARRARIYQAVADDYQRSVKGWTVTSTGPYSTKPYFLRLTKDGNPNAGTTYSLGNGSVTADQRSVVDGGFQDLVRLGALPADDADVVNSLKVLDTTIAEQTPTGTGYYRYGTSGAGSEDGYGDCWTPDPTDCPKDGQPWPTTDKGSGHLWPVLSGERAETALAQGDRALAQSQLAFMADSASGVGLVPEQVWEDPDVAADPYGSDPRSASIGFQDGHAAGSASPLTWAQAQRLRLIVDLDARRIVDRPDITTARYVDHAPPAQLPLQITTPTDGSSVTGTITVAGTTTPGVTVDVTSAGLSLNAAPVLVTTRATDTGQWSVQLPSSFGTNVITAVATTSRGTGYAQVTVTGDVSGATSVLDVTDPSGDDHGPGTYQYPTAADFHDGAFDLTRFQVLTQGGTVYLRATLRDLTPTFSNSFGAQLLDVFVHRAGDTGGSTAAPYPSRNYTLAQPWSERVEVQGFDSPQWVNADGSTAGSVEAVVVSQANRTVTVALPAAQFGTPASGWSFAVVLTGQDGFSADKARAFTATPGGYSFGVCAAGGTSPICAVDPNTVPKAMDVLTPDGVAQQTELDPIRGPVTIAAVAVP